MSSSVPPSASRARPRIAVEPRSGRFQSLIDAVEAGGGEVVPVGGGGAEALVWADAAARDEMPRVLAEAGDSLRWVALPFAGIEPYVPFLDRKRVWTAAKGVYASPCAEHALALALSGMRRVAQFARATTWPPRVGRSLLGARVVVFGGGGITSEFLRLLAPFRCHVTVVRRSSEPFPGADRTIKLGDRLGALRDADLVVLALALTDETRGVIGAEELRAMPQHAWLVNVARGGHVRTDELVAALAAGEIGGAALDVTDPEPLPDGHPLWTEPRAIISPHTANTEEMGVPLLADHIRRNVASFAAGGGLEGVVDVEAGY